MNKKIEEVLLNRELKRNIADIRHYEDEIENNGEHEYYTSCIRELHAEQEMIKEAYREL